MRDIRPPGGDSSPKYSIQQREGPSASRCQVEMAVEKEARVGRAEIMAEMVVQAVLDPPAVHRNPRYL
eukprot:9483657-Pyramimonas_sp.AAC.1